MKLYECCFTSQRSSCRGDDDSDHHADRRHAVPQHAHADAEREEWQAAFKHHVHGQAEATQGPQRQSGLQSGQDTHRGKILHTHSHTQKQISAC